jgi:DNA polymerase-1
MVEEDRLVVRTFNKGVSDTTTYNEKMVFEKYGLLPRQMVDYKSLVGDPSDNIKGVSGIGPKTATEFIKKYGDIDALYLAAEKDEKLKKRLGDSKKEAEFSRELVILERHVPLEMPTLEDLAVSEDDNVIESYFEKKGFATLLKRIAKNEKEGKIKKEEKKNRQEAMF